MAAAGPTPEDRLCLFERRAHCAVLHEERLYCWGGIIVVTERMEDDSSDESDSDDSPTPVLPTAGGLPPGIFRIRKNLPHTEKNLIDVYNVQDKLWYQYSTKGDVPPPDYGAAMCSHGSDYLYLFGGYNEFNFSSDLRRLHLSTMVWEKMQPTSPVLPTPVYRTSILPYKDRLVVFGGVSVRVSDEKLREANAQFTAYQVLPREYGQNNEYHEFYVSRGCWEAVRDVADRPPPIGGHCMVHFDSHRAVVYGGTSGNTVLDSLYVVDLETRAFHHIPKPEHANTPWPLVRMYHPLCTLINPDTVWGEEVEEKQSVFVLWGRYGNELVEVADRAGFFTLDKDLRNVSWTEAWVPLAPRYWHTASCYRPPGSRAVQLLVFGGNLPAYTVRLGDMVKCPTTGLRKWRGDFRILQWGSDFPTLRSLSLDVIADHLDKLSDHLQQKLSPALEAEAREHARKKRYYPVIPIRSRPLTGKELEDGSDSTQFLCGVGYGWSIPRIPVLQ